MVFVALAASCGSVKSATVCRDGFVIGPRKEPVAPCEDLRRYMGYALIAAAASASNRFSWQSMRRFVSAVSPMVADPLHSHLVVGSRCQVRNRVLRLKAGSSWLSPRRSRRSSPRICRRESRQLSAKEDARETDMSDSKGLAKCAVYMVGNV